LARTTPVSDSGFHFWWNQNWNWNWNYWKYFLKELDMEVLSKSQELGNTDFISLLLHKAKKEEKQESPKH
jgi:hypothetical protein